VTKVQLTDGSDKSNRIIKLHDMHYFSSVARCCLDLRELQFDPMFQGSAQTAFYRKDISVLPFSSHAASKSSRDGVARLFSELEKPICLSPCPPYSIWANPYTVFHIITCLRKICSNANVEATVISTKKPKSWYYLTN